MNYKNSNTGEVISEREYNRLSYSERYNFVRTYDSVNSRESEDDSIIDAAIGFGIGLALDNIIGNSDDSSNSGSSDGGFDGFGGGDSGGAGASGDW